VRPSSRLLALVVAWTCLGLLAAIWPQLVSLWIIGGALLGACSLTDAVTLCLLKPPTAERKPPGRFALGMFQEVSLTLRNPGRFGAAIEVFDGVPEDSECHELPWKGRVAPSGYTTLVYPIKLMKRGSLSFTPAHILRNSPLGLWRRRTLAGSPDEVKVYPNYEPVVRFALLAMEHRESQMGIIRKIVVGVSKEFHQLREYQEGDVLSQIDWKATAKRHQLISREFEEQRNQNIILLVDSGQRMRPLDGGLPQFDHCLNAMLLLSYIALRQGDKVGVLSFGGENRWLPPVKGQHSMTHILNHLYDYETSSSPSDFSEAAEHLLIRQRTRALVVVLTNLRSEDSSSIIPALRLMKRRHLVLVSSLRESILDEHLARPVQKFQHALDLSAIHLYLRDRRRLFDQLQSYGILTVDETAQHLPIALTNKYLDIKGSGRL
jgi:uncharacterized protein (DUF58 family)